MRVFINSILRARRFKYDCETGRKNHGEPLHHAVYIYILQISRFPYIHYARTFCQVLSVGMGHVICYIYKCI